MHDAFDDSPIPINLILASLGLVIGLAIVIFVAIKAKEMREDKCEPGVTTPLLRSNHKNMTSADRLSTLIEAQDEV